MRKVQFKIFQLKTIMKWNISHLFCQCHKQKVEIFKAELFKMVTHANKMLTLRGQCTFIKVRAGLKLNPPS